MYDSPVFKQRLTLGNEFQKDIMEQAQKQIEKAKKKHCDKDFTRSRPFMETAQLICEEATTHGIGHAWNNRYNCLGAFWVVVTLLLLGLLWFNVIEFVVEFFQRNDKSQTTSHMVEVGLQLPSVSLCNKAFFSRRKLQALGISDLANYLVGITGSFGLIREDFTMSKEGHDYLKNAHNQLMGVLADKGLTMKGLIDAISYDCEEMLVMCSVARRRMNSTECCHAMIGIPTLSGKCFVYYSNHTLENMQRVEGELLGVSLYVRIDPDDQPVLNPDMLDISLVMKTGPQLSLFSNLTHPCMSAIGHGVSISPRMYTSTEVSLSVVKDIGLKTLIDWNLDACVPESSVGYLHDLEAFFLTQPNCDVGGLRSCFRLQCNCSYYALDLLDESLEPCSFLDMVRCYTHSFPHLGLQTRSVEFMDYLQQLHREREKDNWSQCLETSSKKCRRPCARYDYSYTSSRSPIHQDIYDNLLKEFNLPEGSEVGVVTTFFPKMRYTEVHMWRESFADLISTVGGVTGVLLGCSVVSFIEFFVAMALFLGIVVRKGRGTYHKTEPSS